MILLKDYRLPKGLLKLDIAIAYHGYFAERGTAYIPSKEVQHKYFFPVSNKGEFIDRLGHPITAERIAGTCFHSDSEGFKLYYNEGKFHKKDGGIPELNVFRHCASLVETGQDIAGIGIWYKGAPFIVASFDFSNGFAKDVRNPVEEQSLISMLEHNDSVTIKNTERDSQNNPQIANLFSNSSYNTISSEKVSVNVTTNSINITNNKKEIKTRENGKHKFLSKNTFEIAVREWAAREYDIDLPHNLIVGQETKCQTLNDKSKGKQQSENEYDARYYYEVNGPCCFIMVYNYETSKGDGISNFNKDLCYKYQYDCKEGIDTTNYKNFYNRIKQIKKEQELNREEEYKTAQLNAIEIYKKGISNFTRCPYLEQKGFDMKELRRDNADYCFNLRMLNDDTLLIPIRHPDFNNDISCLQTINLNRDKQKLFTKHGKTKGGYVFFPSNHSGCKEIILCEGIATGLSIWYATKAHVFCCLNAGGLIAVAEEIKKRQITSLGWGEEEITQEHRISICADNDQYLSKDGKKKANTGVEAAMAAADILEATYIVPRFIDTTDHPTDFNDLHRLEGLSTVQIQIEQNQQIAPCLDFVKQAAMSSEEYLSHIQGLPVIHLESDKMDFHARQVEELLNHGIIFQHCGRLKRLRKVIIADNKLSDQRDMIGNLQSSLIYYSSDSAIFEELTPQIAATEFPKYARFTKIDKRHQNEDGSPSIVSCRIPKTLINDILSLESWPRVRPCKILAHCPIVTPEGKVIFRVGYDRQTQVYLDIPANLKINMGMSIFKAKNLIDSSIEEYSFKSDIDRVGAIAGMLTPFIRPMILTAPGLAISADTPGTGKSTLAQQIGVIATGTFPDTLSWNSNPQEREKSLDSHFLSGRPILLIDNVPNDYECNDDKINSTISLGSTDIRLFGTQDLKKVEIRSMIMITGNHMQPTIDMTRRFLFINLHSDMEHPEEREFNRNVLEWSKENRSQLVSAGIVLLSSFLSNKSLVESIKLSPFGSFEEWSRTIRKTVVHYWGIDPYETVRQAKESDPERIRRLAFLEEWVATFGINSERTLKSVLDTAANNEELRESIQALSKGKLAKDELPTGVIFSKTMKMLEGKNIGGLMVKKSKEQDTHTHKNYWYVTRVQTD